MSLLYHPQDHIQHLDVAPRAEGFFGQREITIQSYKTTVPFDYDSLDTKLERAWLTPQNRLGVFSRIHSGGKNALNVVLGLQDNLAVRTYDYDERRPLWYSWQNIIVDTVNIRYYKNDEGFLCFATTGGGRRITDDRLDNFNNSFLGIAKEAVTKLHFDLTRLRDLCFNRFVENLYMIKFSDPSGQEYRSIDHALFKSRQYIDPGTERLCEIQADKEVKVESFDSDINVCTQDLAAGITVRFFLRGQSGSLRLRFPKIRYKDRPKTPQQQTEVFYRVVDVTVNSILDEDYYAQQQKKSLDDLDADLGLFPDNVDLTPFREVLTNEEDRSKFFADLDLAEPWQKWRPHLWALNELSHLDAIEDHISFLIGELTKHDPDMAGQLLSICQNDPKVFRIGVITANELSAQLYGVPVEKRASIEHILLSWAIAHEQDTWDIDLENDELNVFNLRWKTQHLSTETIPAVLWKLVGILHQRLLSVEGEAGILLSKFDWCVAVARTLATNQSNLLPALRLIIEERIPRTVGDGASVLKTPVKDINALDKEILAQFGLPLWPLLTATKKDDKVVLSNMGIGAAVAIKVDPTKNRNKKTLSKSDLPAGESVSLKLTSDLEMLDVQFEKFGKCYLISIPVDFDDKADVETGSDAEIFKWARQAELRRATIQVLGEEESPSVSKISRAIKDGKIKFNGESGRKSRVSVDDYLIWIAKDRKLGNDEVKQLQIAIVGELNA